MKQLKYRGEIRKGITENTGKIKNTYLLQELYRLTDIVRRVNDEEEYKAITEPEFALYGLVLDILNVKEEQQYSKIRAWVNAYTGAARRLKIKSSNN